MGKGLNKEVIVAEAVRIIESGGYAAFSLRELAQSLGVKPASLYNHVGGLEEINLGVMQHFAGGLNSALCSAIVGEDRDADFISAVVAYRKYAEDNRNLYDAFITIPKADRTPYKGIGFSSFTPIRELMASYGLPEEDLMTLDIALVSFLHGNLEMTAGRFPMGTEVTDDKLFLRITHGFLKLIKTGGGLDLPYTDHIKQRLAEKRRNKE